MIWLVRAVVKTYKPGAWGYASAKLVEVEADDAEQAKAVTKNFIGQQVKDEHNVTCTAVFQKGCQLNEYRAEITYMSTDEFDDYATEGRKNSFYFQAPNIDEAKKIAKEEMELHLHQYAYPRGLEVFELD